MARRAYKASEKLYPEVLDHARSWREQRSYDSTWSRMVDLYRGKQWNAPSENPRVTANRAFSTINVIGPSVSVNYPKISVNAAKPGFEAQATVSQAVLNYQWRHFDFRRPIRRCVDDSLIIGHGWSKVTWKYTEATRPLTDDELAAEFEVRTAEARAAAEENPDIADQLPTDEEILDNLQTTTQFALEDRPVVARISPFDIYVSPEATSMDDVRWIAQRRIERLKDVKENKVFESKARKNLKANLALTANSGRDQDQAERLYEDEGLVTIWEFYDLTEGKVCVFPESFGKETQWLAKPQDLPFDHGHPFTMLRNHDIPDSFYPMGELEAIEGLQLELNATRSDMVSFRKKYARKHMVRTEHLSPEGIQALTSNEDNELVPVVSDQPFEQIVSPVPQSPLPGDIWNFSQQCANDIDSISGVGEYARGGSSQIRKTATEAAMVQDAANARSSDKLDRVEAFIADTARKLLGVNQQFLTTEAVARVVGDGGQEMWFDYTADMIEGEYDFEVEAGSTQPTNESFKRQQAITMAQVMMPFVGVVVRPGPLARHLLTDGFGIKDVDDYMIDPQVQAQRAQQAQAEGEEGPLPTPGGGPGMDAPQPDPLAGPEEAPSDIAGIPPELVDQLQAQMGMGAGV